MYSASIAAMLSSGRFLWFTNPFRNSHWKGLTDLNNMKLRLDEHSVRLRLSKSDIETLDNQGSVRTFTALPGGTLEYCIETGTNLERTECILTGSALKVLLPVTQAEKWTNSEDVGIYASLPAGIDGKEVQIILEKDFPCKHGNTGNQSDRFDDLASQQKKR
jgi:hypothetical protein